MSADFADLSFFRASDAAVHFVGCGGVGTAPLMRIFHQKGFRVSGSDLIDNLWTRELRSMGLQVFSGPHSADHLPDCAPGKLLLIHTSAAGAENPELQEAVRRGACLLRRGEALAALCKMYPRVIAVSGSHGKTSVTAMIAFVLKELNMNPGYLVGGGVVSWLWNGDAGDGRIFVTEADESDGTHALLRPTLTVVTNIEDDHAWSLGGFEVLERNFRTAAQNSDHLLYLEGDTPDRLFAGLPNAHRVVTSESYEEQLFPPEVSRKMGGFQLRNARTAMLALEMEGVPREKSMPVLARFPGVERRMSVRFDSDALRIVEDYAHHPTELHASLSALRKTNRGRRLCVVFQPHRYARLERYFQDFVRELSTADFVFTVPVFAAWCASGKYTSDDLAAALSCPARSLSGSWPDIAAGIRKELRPGDTLALIGAGDVHELIPLLTPVS